MAAPKFKYLQSAIWCGIFAGITAQASEFPEPTNNQATRNSPLTDPASLLEMMTLPEGFKATVFASEPAVQNPIAMCWDERGRMWVAENYTYSDQHERFDLKLRDRILIFEDSDSDGRFDKRTVFADDFQRLTSIERGLGGVYALCPPHLLFIPCENDKPSGEPVILLDGFGTEGSQRHTIANGLKWGPDGWLYGRIGISRTCLIGTPGTPTAERQPTAGGIWRFHPTHHTFELYCHGTTNPWGSDWNEDGELFFINTVIGHLWHGIPGAHFKRMYGEDPYPHIYEFIDQHADHYHWDTGKNWQQSRSATGLTDDLGGGHAHVGMTIYQGDQFPAVYRGQVFTTNLHGRRINVERLEKNGSGYVAKHEPDFMTTRDPWFRAVEVSTGPDGSLFVLDWSDIGECHENDGVHRTSGRIYRISHGDPPPLELKLASLDDRELIKLQSSSNEWIVRMARWVLRERVHEGGLARLSSVEPLIAEALPAVPNESSEEQALKNLWLRSTLRNDGKAAFEMLPWLGHDAPRLHAQLIKILSDQPGAPVRTPTKDLSPAIWTALTDPTFISRHASTRLALASALPKLQPTQRTQLARLLLSHPEDAGDHNLPLLIWSGISELPLAELVGLFPDCRIPKIRRFITRRVAEEINQSPDALNQLLMHPASDGARERLQGMTDAFQGWKSAPEPEAWKSFRTASSNSEELRPITMKLSLLFGGDEILLVLRRTLQDPNVDPATRRSALRTMVELRSPDLRALCESNLDQPELAALAIQGLGVFKDPEIATLLLSRYADLPLDAKGAALELLSSRPASAHQLLDQLGEAIPRTDLSTLHARQIQQLNKPELSEKLSKRWGELRNSPEDLKQSMEAYRAKLTPEFIARGNLGRGRVLFKQTCASCHKLYGEGGTIGPDITGSGRHHVDYLIENIVDPSAVVASDQQLLVLYLKDGRVLNGMIRQQTPQTLTLSMSGQDSVIPRDEIRHEEKLPVSMMPSGLLDSLNDRQLADLVAYLMSEKQSSLPE